MPEFEVRGLRELGQNLQKLPEVLREKILRKSMYKASKVVIREVRAQIDSVGLHERSGSLKKRIGSKVIKRKLTNQMALVIGPIMLKGGTKEERQIKRSKMKIERDPFYSRYLEFGTEHISGRHFYAKAFYASKEAYIEHLRQEVQLVMETELKKAFGLSRKSR